MKNINVTANKGKFLVLPLLIILAGIIMFFVNSNTKDSGFNYDIEFMGGVRMQVEMENVFDNEEVSSFLEEKLGISPIIVQAGSGTTATIKTLLTMLRKI